MLRILVVLISVFMASPVWAAEKVKIEEVVVTASKMEEALEDTTSEVTIVKSEDIKKMNVTFVTDVLRKIPDLSFTQSGGDGKYSSILLRGGDPKHTLVLIDGVKVNSNTTGTFDISGIPAEDIERIEIVKGAQSTIYGSEAMAGVINIITKKGEGKLKAEASFEAGSYGTYNPSATVSGGEKALSYRITAQYYHTDGISSAKSGTEKDGYNNAYISWKFGHKTSEKIELELSGSYYNDRSELDGYSFTTGSAADDPNFVQHANHFLLSAKGKLYLSDKWEQILTLSTFRDSMKFTDPDTSYNEADILNKRNVIDWQHNLYLTSAVSLTAGLEYRKESGENKGSFDETVDNKAVYFNSKLKFLKDRLVLNAGLRYDDHETAGSKTTYKIGASYNFKEAGLLVRTSYGTGFRAPSMNDLFYPFYGNPLLKPEESESFEAGIEKRLLNDKALLSLTFFAQDYENLIQADPATYTATNIARAAVRGVEANASVKVTESIDIKAGYTYLDTEDKDTGTRLIRRPQNKVSLSIGYIYRDLSLLADCIYADSRLNSSGGEELSPYMVVNLSGNYRIGKNITVFGRVENLFDEDYEEVKGYSTKGLSAYGGIKVTL